MVEQQILFMSDTLKLEGLIQEMPGDKAVVITHPHSLYGGSMHNHVVESLNHVYQHTGYTTLRFNFRGVGRSQGEYDQGRGEREDVKSALRFLSEQGKEVIDLAGYSFGAWVNGHARLKAHTLRRMIMVAPPVAFLDFTSMPPAPQLELVIAGGRDQIAPVDLIETMLPDWNPGARLKVIEGADHFYAGHTSELEHILAEHLAAESAEPGPRL
jgi:alpha/beta superfamily hydrolase